jgi:hypothetical protein
MTTELQEFSRQWEHETAGTLALLHAPSPESVARAIFDGVEKGEEDIFPDPMSESMAESWRSGAAKALERQYAALVEAEPLKS